MVGLEVVWVVVVCAFCLLALVPPTGMRRNVELACALGFVCQYSVMTGLVKRERGKGGGVPKRGQTNARVEESRCSQDPDDDEGGSCQDDEPEAAGAGDTEAVLVQA